MLCLRCGNPVAVDASTGVDQVIEIVYFCEVCQWFTIDRQNTLSVTWEPEASPVAIGALT